MYFNMFRHYKIILFAFGLYSLPSCYFGGGYNTSNLSLFQSLPSVGESSFPSDSEYFYIDLDRQSYEPSGGIIPYYEISTTEAFGDAEERDSPSNCEIPLVLPEDPDDIQKIATEETLTCILDILEYDLMVKDLHIVYNFPHGMCDYVKVSLPWHFNYPPIQGPYVDTCKIRDTTSTEDRYCDASQCQAEEDNEHSIRMRKFTNILCRN